MSVHKIEGVRVVRGPDWSYGDDDGGEGHVGTITQDNEDDTVEVQWDMGNDGTYNTGKDGKKDLRVLDSASAGVKHDDVTCDGCRSSAFSGTRWKCQSCPDFDLCSPCYFKDAHDTQHPFSRIDLPRMRGSTVPKRSGSRKIVALGMFKGAKVKRGVDWNCGDQDGGDGKIGKVEETKTYGTTGPERDSVSVTWPNNQDGSYRLGYHGKVDLVCVEKTRGMDFYRDHLFAIDTTQAPKMNSSLIAKRASMRENLVKSMVRPVSAAARGGREAGGRTVEGAGKSDKKLKIGDKVCVNLPELELKEAQRGHGGWTMRMTEYIGQQGIVKKLEDNGDCVIGYDDKEWRFNGAAVCIIPQLKLGDTVRIINDGEKVKALQKRHGGWQSEMQSSLGQVGKVVKIDSDGDVAVAFGSRAWVFNPACCEPASGEKVADLEGGRSGSAGSETRPGSSGARGGSAGSRSSDDTDTEVEEAADALGQLIAGLLLFRGMQTSVGPQHLVSAAANNDSNMVQKVLSKNPKLVDQKHQGLTALIISSHEGYKAVVKILLDAGANIDIREGKGNTALMAALMKKREEVAQLLIDAGANITLWNTFGRTALHFAASNGCNTTLRVLLQKGAEPNRQDFAGDTPLHDAINNKNDSGIAFLVAHPGVNLKLCNKKGHSPLHLASMKDDEITVSRILSKAPELKNASKADGYTALHCASVNNNTDVMKTLIKANVDVNRKTENNYTALHLACHQGYLEAAKMLVEASADVDIQDNDGDTALHNTVMGRRSAQRDAALAAMLLGIRLTNEEELKERTSLACFLIQHGANVAIRNKRGRTAVECCSDERMRNTIRDFAQKHGKQGGGGARAQTAANLLAQLFSDLPLPCMGCMEKLADCKFAPCGHRVCCKSCAFRVRACPMCDNPIQERFDLDGRRLALADPCKVQ